MWDHPYSPRTAIVRPIDEVVEAFFIAVRALADKRNLLSKERFLVDSVLI